MKSAYSGKFVLRIDPSLHEKLSIQAMAKNLSLNQVISNTLINTQNEIIKNDYTQKIINIFKDEIVGIILFGSYARSEETKDSDIDILIFTKSKPDRSFYNKFDNIFQDSENLSPHFAQYKNDIMTYGSLVFEVSLDGLILFDDCNKTHKLLSKIRKEIAHGHLKRKTSYGHPYWIINIEG